MLSFPRAFGLVDEIEEGRKDSRWTDEGAGYPRLWWEFGDGASP